MFQKCHHYFLKLKYQFKTIYLYIKYADIWDFQTNKIDENIPVTQQENYLEENDKNYYKDAVPLYSDNNRFDE